MPTVAQLQGYIRKHKDKNCPAFSKLKKAQLLALVKQLGIDVQEVKVKPPRKKTVKTRKLKAPDQTVTEKATPTPKADTARIVEPRKKPVAPSRKAPQPNRTYDYIFNVEDITGPTPERVKYLAKINKYRFDGYIHPDDVKYLNQEQQDNLQQWQYTSPEWVAMKEKREAERKARKKAPVKTSAKPPPVKLSELDKFEDLKKTYEDCIQWLDDLIKKETNKGNIRDYRKQKRALVKEYKQFLKEKK
jgi:hypothetical protein